MTLNRATLIGNVGQDPEFITTKNDQKMAKFSLATTETWKDKATGERKEKTEWHNIVVYNPGLITIIERYVKKGEKLFVEGKIATHKYLKNDVNHTATEIVLSGFDGIIRLLGSKPEHKAGSAPIAEAPQVEGNADLDDEIPF